VAATVIRIFCMIAVIASFVAIVWLTGPHRNDYAWLEKRDMNMPITRPPWKP
jgi:hypothetical protein